MSDFPPEFRCRCGRHSLVCQRKATQEDMRCDACREGCSLIGIGEPPGRWFHAVITDWKFASLNTVPPGWL